MHLAIIFTVILSSLITFQNASPVRQKDLEDVLELLNKRDQDLRVAVDRYSSESSSDDDSDSGETRQLRSKDVIELIRKADEDKVTMNNENLPQKRGNPDTHFEDKHLDSEIHRIIYKLLQDKSTNKHQRLTPHNLLGPITLDEKQEQPEKTELTDYSTVFVLLDPLAVQKSKNKEALTNLVSRILSLSSSTGEKAHQEKNKNHRYGGFRVKDNVLARRYRRESKEGFGGGRDSMEEDFKPKRPRSEHGGGGTGGRTAIPYIHQRGDIYERDH